MGYDFFSSKQSANTDLSEIPDNILFAQLTTIAETLGLTVFNHTPIFHRKEQQAAPCLIFDPQRGFYLFDTLDWEYDYLQNATVSPALDPNAPHALNVDAPHRFIEQKLDAHLHHEAAPIVNFLHFSKLKEAEFESLHSSFHKLLPRSRLLFADDSSEAIEKKLGNALESMETPLKAERLLSALFFQYTLLPDTRHKDLALLNAEQRRYIDMPLPRRTLLHGGYGSGKSTLLLLKAMLEKLLKPKNSLAIVAQSNAACDFMKQRLLQVIESAMIYLDPLAIEIMTPEQFLVKNRAVDQLFCDDAHLLTEAMLERLERTQLKHAIHFAGVDPSIIPYEPIALQQAYRTAEHLRCRCSCESPDPSDETLLTSPANSYIFVLNLVQKLLREGDEEQILIAVPNLVYAQRLKEEIEGFLGIEPTIFDAERHILYQEINHLLIAPIEHTVGIVRDYALVLVSETAERSPWIAHALGRAAKTAYLISDTELTKE